YSSILAYLRAKEKRHKGALLQCIVKTPLFLEGHKNVPDNTAPDAIFLSEGDNTHKGYRISLEESGEPIKGIIFPLDGLTGITEDGEEVYSLPKSCHQTHQLRLCGVLGFVCD